MTEKTIDWKIICVGILALTAIEIIALFNGVNGTVLSAIIAIIAFTIGVTIPTPKLK